MSEKPLVSIVIPCYNQSQYLTECIHSVVSQVFLNWEAIVVNDASPNSEMIATIVAGFGDSRLRVVCHEQNRGLAAARNTGIYASIGEYILVLDADDKLECQYLEKTVSCFIENPEYDCVFTDFQLFGARDDIWPYQVRDVSAMLETQWIPGAGSLFKKRVWEKVGGYCESERLRIGNEDWDFWISAMEKHLRAAHIPEPFYFYRQHPGAMSSRLRYSDHLTREFIYNRHKALFAQYKKGRTFRADGYQRSAEASWERKERLRTAYLAFRGWLLTPQRRNLVKLAIKALLPDYFLSVVHKTRRWTSNLSQRGDEQILYATKPNRKAFWEDKANNVDRFYGNLTHDYAVVREIINSIVPKHILDFGCGSGRLFPLYSEMGISDVVGQDISEGALNLSRKRIDTSTNIELVSAPVEKLEFAENHFDLVICNRVLQHIPPGEIEQTINKVCYLSRCVYINELSITEVANQQCHQQYLFAHDYEKLFEQNKFEKIANGNIPSESGSQQEWALFRKLGDI